MNVHVRTYHKSGNLTHKINDDILNKENKYTSRELKLKEEMLTVQRILVQKMNITLL